MSIRRLNRAFLRLFPFIIFVVWVIDFILASYNVYTSEIIRNTFGISLITIVPLWLAVECDSKYNCKHIRWMYGCIFTCQIINVFDYIFDIFPSYNLLFICLKLVIITTFLALFILAIQHFFVKSK